MSYLSLGETFVIVHQLDEMNLMIFTSFLTTQSLKQQIMLRAALTYRLWHCWCKSWLHYMIHSFLGVYSSLFAAPASTNPVIEHLSMLTVFLMLHFKLMRTQLTVWVIEHMSQIDFLSIYIAYISRMIVVCLSLLLTYL